ncbi:MAG: LysR family transcriptional regulator [Marinobacter sp.]
MSIVPLLHWSLAAIMLQSVHVTVSSARFFNNAIAPKPFSRDALTTIHLIARSGSFAVAAERLNRVPSAVNYTVKKLEEKLGFALFDRSGHQARLTAAG